jgi:hypothetical protein
LETDSLTVELTPLKTIPSCQFSVRPNHWQLAAGNWLLNFFVQRVLAAPAAELLQFQTVRRRFAVLSRRIVPLFAIATLQRNNLSGHCSLPKTALGF